MSATAGSSSVRLKEGEELFARLGVVFTYGRLFSSRHPRFFEGCQAFVDALDRFFRKHEDQEHVLFVRRRGTVYFRKVPLVGLTPPAIRLSSYLEEQEIEGIRFGRDCNITALAHSVEALAAAEQESGPVWRTANGFLANLGLKSKVSFFTDREVSALDDRLRADDGTPSREDDETTSGDDSEPHILGLPRLQLPVDLYKRTLVALHDLMAMVDAGGTPALDPVMDVTDRIARGIIDDAHSFLPLASVRYGDGFTFNHSVNVCLLVTGALKPLVRRPDRLVEAGRAALLHDLGKARIDRSLLYTTTVPDRDARDEIERHPYLGAQVLLDSPGVDPLSVSVAFHHHRRDGARGYPRLRRDRPVDLVTSLIAAADILEALTAERPYKCGLSVADAFRVFTRLPEARGLEPAARLLLEVLGLYPPGTWVELDSGDLAVVTRTPSGRPHQPIVRRVERSGGELALCPEELDLSLPSPDASALHVIRATHRPRWADTTATEDLVPSAEDPRREEREEGQRDLERRLAEGTLLASEG